MKFYKIPFVWLVIPFMFGLITTEFISVTFNYAITLFIVSTSILIFLFFEKKICFNFYCKIALIILCLFFGGYSIMSLETANNKEVVSNNKWGESLYIGTIKELSITHSGYLKCIIDCKKSNPNSTQFKKSKKLIFIKLDSTKKRLSENNKILFYGKFEKIKNIGYPGEFDGKNYWRNKGIYDIAFVNPENVKVLTKKKSSYLTPTSIRNSLTQVLETVLSGQELALANALILGERSLLTNETTQQFGSTGAMHILAVSGLHIGILLQILLKLFQPFQKYISKNKATIFSLIIVWIYALITGFSASVVRSVIMFSFILIGNIKGKENSELNILALSAFLILAWNPYFIYDVGFQLSYAAMVGIYLFYPYLKKVIISSNKTLQLIIEGTMVGIAAQITTVPLTLYYFHQFPNYFIITNIALMAFSFLILLFGILLFTFYWIPIMKILLGILLHKIMSLMLTIVSFISHLPYSTANGFYISKWMVVLFYVSISVFFIALFYRKIKLLYFSLALTTLLLVVTFQNRISQNIQNLTFIYSKRPTFTIIKSGTTNYFLFHKYAWKSNKTKKIIRDFSNLHPGKPVLVPLEKLSHKHFKYFVRDF